MIGIEAFPEVSENDWTEQSHELTEQTRKNLSEAMDHRPGYGFFRSGVSWSFLIWLSHWP